MLKLAVVVQVQQIFLRAGRFPGYDFVGQAAGAAGDLLDQSNTPLGAV